MGVARQRPPALSGGLGAIGGARTQPDAQRPEWAKPLTLVSAWSVEGDMPKSERPRRRRFDRRLRSGDAIGSAPRRWPASRIGAGGLSPMHLTRSTKH
jgi:hypothetical protein